MADPQQLKLIRKGRGRVEPLANSQPHRQARPPRGGPHAGVPQRGEPQQGGPPRGEPQRGEPHAGVPQGSEPPRGVPRRDGPQGGGPQGANLYAAHLIGTNLEDAILTGARVYGISAWDVNLQHAVQTSLLITPSDLPKITVDNLEVAQFIYLLLNNSKIRGVIDTITSKAVLILGRFTPERKTTLDTLRNALRSHNRLPILFDFEMSTNRDFSETVSTLAHLARFVIADLTDPRSIPQELDHVIRNLLSVPVRPLLLGSQSEWAMFRDLARFPQVTRRFTTPMTLCC